MRKKAIKISLEIINQMTGHALLESPNECCGLLSGREGFIDEIRCCENERSSPSEFSISPPELFEFFRSLRDQEREFLGVYHSHPDGKHSPSSRDEEEFHYRDTSYWIVSLNNGLAGVRCFGWGQVGFVEMPFTVVDSCELFEPPHLK